MSKKKPSLWSVKQRYGKSNGKDREAEEELQRRGLNSKQLAQIIWDYAQEGWRREAKKASKIRAARKRSVRNAKNRRHSLRRKESRRQEQIARVARLKKGVKIVGEGFDQFASEGSCPF